MEGAMVDLSETVAALAADPLVIQKLGQVLVTASLAEEYGFTDIDGTQPVPLPLSAT
jgi:dehydrogenase/reductase SDR family member 1